MEAATLTALNAALGDLADTVPAVVTGNLTPIIAAVATIVGVKFGIKFVRGLVSR